MPPHLECQALAGFPYGARADRRQEGPFGNGPGSGPGRTGDSLVVWRFDRLARSVRHMLDLAARLERRGCQLVSLTEAIDTGTPGGRLVFVLFARLAEVESDLARERTRLARERGDLWGRRSPFHNPGARPQGAGHAARQAAAQDRHRQGPRHRRLDALQVVPARGSRRLSGHPHGSPGVKLSAAVRA